MAKRRYTMQDWRNVKAALAAGMTVRAAAEATGVDRNAVWRWAGLDDPPERMWLDMELSLPPAGEQPRARSPRQRLSYEDRCMIYALKLVGRSDAEIAREVGVHRSTVGRELGRAAGGYDPRAAQLDACRAAKRPKGRKLDASGRLRAYVSKALALRWSPEQISRRIRRDFPDDEEMRVSAETVYQAIYAQARGGLEHGLGASVALRSGRTARRPRPRRSGGGDKPWVEGASISDRPPEAADRAVPGHWEGDLVIGGDMSSCLITLVERRSRFLLMSRLGVHDAETVEERLVGMVAGLPAELSKTLTWDQGVEMAKVADFELSTDFKVYFCDPHSPWQRPSNENTNGLIREFFPKGTRFTDVTDEEVARAQRLLNNRPRACLDWKSPSEIMAELLGDVAMTD